MTNIKISEASTDPYNHPKKPLHFDSEKDQYYTVNCNFNNKLNSLIIITKELSQRQKLIVQCF